MNPVQSVYIIAIPPTGVCSLWEYTPRACGLRSIRTHIPNNLLHSRWYITDIYTLPGHGLYITYGKLEVYEESHRGAKRINPEKYRKD